MDKRQGAARHSQRTRGEDSVSPIDWFVAELSRELDHRDNAADQRTRRVVRRLVEFATREGLPLDREVIFDPDNVERFVEVGLAHDRSAATYRSVLRSIGPRVTKSAPWEPRATPIARRSLAPPYTAGEVALLVADATLQPTNARRRSARALLALGLGAGLDGRWVAKVRAPDVERNEGFVVVRVGAPCPREIVVLGDYEHEVLELAATARDDYLVGGRSRSKNRAGALAASLVVPTGHPVLSQPRLRSTWLFTHLVLGTRLPELCQAAGLQGTAMFGELLSLVPPVDDQFAAEMLRGRLR